MRYLSDLVGQEIDRRMLTSGWEEVDIVGITADSRQVKPGFLFAAMHGAAHDGRQFIPQALQHGAAAILTDSLPEGASVPNVPVLYSSNPRHSLAMIASRFYELQPRYVAAVTGTDGKTSVAHFYQQLWRLMGKSAASIGTLGVVAPENVPEHPALNTTPDPVLLHATLKTLANHGVQHVALEASSHGIHQHRLDGVHIRVAGFTNLTRDHLDYHGTEEAYFHAKQGLFTDVMQGGGVAVLNGDDPHAEALENASKATGHKVMRYGKAGRELKLLSIIPHATGQQVAVEICGETVSLDIPLIGAFQVMNVLCASGMVIAEGADIKDVVAAIPLLHGVPGRMERVTVHASGAPVFVDYAHTPAGLQSVLSHIRPHVEKRLVVVFGCGGNRDRGKRPLMGKIAAEYADIVFVTDDNPRTENPALVRKDVMQGCPGAAEIPGRMEAITAAVRILQAGDALVIAGKGHEKIQIIGDKTHPFDDAEVARSAVRLLQEGTI